MQRRLNIAIGISISLVAIYLASTGVDYVSVWASLRRAEPLLVGLALGSSLLNNLAKAIRWKILMGERGAAIGTMEALRIHLASQMINSLLPARVGDLSRVYMAGELGVGRAFLLGTVAIEKVIDLICYLLLFVLLLFLMPLPSWVNQPTYLLIALVVAATVIGVFIRQRGVTLPEWLPSSIRSRGEALISGGLASLQILSDMHGILGLIFWSALVWISALLTNVLSLMALGIATPLAAPLLVLFVLIAGINLPSAPGRIGLFQYLCIIALAPFGIAQAIALSFGFLLHILVYLPMIIAGLSLIRFGSRRGEPRQDRG